MRYDPYMGQSLGVKRLRCMRHFVSTSTLKRKDQNLRLTVNYSRVLNTMFEQNRKEAKVGWRKLLDMGLHELHCLIYT